MTGAFWQASAPVVLGAIALDVVLGDPARMPHPVVGIGRLVAAGERALRTGRAAEDLVRGAGLTLVTVAAASATALAALRIAAEAGPLVHAAAAAAIAWTTIALRGLGDAALAVAGAVERGDLDEARHVLPSLVGRDPERLDADGALRAAIESVAENASDAVVAPLFWLVLLGPAGAVAYKAVNTLDSMIGHLDERHRHFGRFAARLDDAVNLAPARLTAGCLAAAAGVRLGRGWAVLRGALRDARRHASPNAGWPEAAMAHALGLRLGGPAAYDGVVEDRAVLGADDRPAEPADVREAVALLRAASAFAVLVLLGARALLGAAA